MTLLYYMMMVDEDFSNRATTLLVLIGDSDIDRWPRVLYPEVQENDYDYLLSGHSGATLEEILQRVRDVLQTIAKAKRVICIVCAGENDIGDGLPLSNTEAAFEKLLDLVFNETTLKDETSLIFLGPKLEPWLKDDLDSRKQYIRMSNSLENLCKDHDCACNIVYVDCLTMFCGSSAHQPGALFGGRAQADTQFFAPDGLHLSDKGYEIWKAVVEDAMKTVLRKR